MDFGSILNSVKKTFDIRKTVDFDEVDLHIVLAPLTSSEELKVIEGCHEMKGMQYVESLKRFSLAYSIKAINGQELLDDISYTDDMDKPKIVSRFIYLTDLVNKMPPPMKELLFAAFTNLQEELEARINKSAKFEKFNAVTFQDDSKEKGEFKPVAIPEDDGDMTEVEKMGKRAQKEVDNEDLKIAMSGSK